MESKEKEIKELIQSIFDLKKKDDIIINLSSHKECKSDSTQEKLQKDLDAMTAKFEALKTQHESEFNSFKSQATQELATLKQNYEAKIQELSN